MTSAAEKWQLDGHAVPVTHLDKLYWPAAGVTKGDMLRYYLQVAPTLLPHMRERPATVRVYPDGIPGESYYQRDRSARAPKWLRGVAYQPKTAAAEVRLMLVDSSAGLIWLANAGSVEFHLWASHLPDLDMPDYAIFDLDPGAEAPFSQVLTAALRLRDALDQTHMRGYPKTSGGRGLHVYVPLAAGYTFDDVRAWVKRQAEQLAARYPDLIAVAHGATHRGDQVTVDYAQNSIARNTAAPYTLRADPTEPRVSSPLTWDEVVAGGLQPADFTPQVALERIQRLGDLFAPVLAAGQQIGRST